MNAGIEPVEADPPPTQGGGRVVLFLRRGLVALAILVLIEAVLIATLFGYLTANQQTLAHEAIPALIRAQDSARLVRQLESEARALLAVRQSFAVEARLLQVRVLTDQLRHAVGEAQATLASAGDTRALTGKLDAWEALLGSIDQIQRRQIAVGEHLHDQMAAVGALQQRPAQIPAATRALALQALGQLSAAFASDDPAEIRTLEARYLLDLPGLRATLPPGALREHFVVWSASFADRVESLRLEQHLEQANRRLVLLESLVTDLEAIAQTLSQRAQHEANAAEQRLLWASVVLGSVILLGIALTVLGLRMVDRKILRRLLRLQRAMQARVQGEARRIPLDGDDEIADMGASFLHFVEAVERREHSLQQNIEHLNRARASLVEAEKLASLGSLIAVLAHELNTPIGCAVTTSSTAADEARGLQRKISEGEAIGRKPMLQTLEKIASCARLAETSLERTAELLAGFRDIAASQRDKKRSRFNPAELVARVGQTMQPSISFAGHQLKLDLIDPGAVDGYAGALNQVLMQFVDNAIKHAFGQHGPGSITLRCLPDDEDNFLIEVADNGDGIADTVRPRLFEPFFTTTLNKGTGMGLYAAHTLVRGRCGGEIEVQSQLGQGTVFRLRLPRNAPDNGADNALAGSDPRAA